MKNNFKRNLLISSLVSLLVLMISSIASFISIKSLLHSNFWVNHTQEVIYNLNEGSAIITEAQTSMRGYLITGDEQFVARYNDSETKSNSYFDKLDELTVDNPSQQKLLKGLRVMRSNFFKYLNNQIVKKRLGKNTAVFDLNEGRKMMNELRAVIKRVEYTEQGLLAERNANSEKYGNYSLILIIVAFFIAFIISIVFLFRILKDFNERSALQLELEKKDFETAQRIEAISTIATNISNGNYDIRVDDTKADALGSVGESLNTMGVNLKNSFDLLSQKEWLQTGIADLNNAMLGEKQLQELSKDIIEFLCNYTKSSAGVMYVMDGDELAVAAGYSYIPSKNRERIQKGRRPYRSGYCFWKNVRFKSVDSR